MKRQKRYTNDIEHLCTKNYFYSRDPKFEGVLDGLENKQAIIIKRIIEDKSLRYLSLKDYIPLYCFIVLQYTRTNAFKRSQSDGLTNYISDTIVNSVLAPNTTAKFQYPAMHSLYMLHALQSIPLLFDLHMVLLINNSEFDVIASDNPIVLFLIFISIKYKIVESLVYNHLVYRFSFLSTTS